MPPHFICKPTIISRQDKHDRNVSAILYESQVLEVKNERPLSIETFIEFFYRLPADVLSKPVPFYSPGNGSLCESY